MGKPIYTFYKDSDWINEKCIEYIYFDEWLIDNKEYFNE